MKYAALMSLSLFLAGCGYSTAPSPYGLMEPLTLNVPVAANQSPYSDLGPRLTREVIGRLDSSSNVTVREGAPAALRLAITKVDIIGGAWTSERTDYNLPEASASRVVSLTVESVLEKGAGPARRHHFSSSRKFYVNQDDNLTKTLEEEAFAWVLDDLAQKITQSLFAEF
jgi:outer membrane lipopolysaccharide assembly protein LptE/RlpB